MNKDLNFKFKNIHLQFKVVHSIAAAQLANRLRTIEAENQ